MLTEQNYLDAANEIGCEPAVIKAVAKIEGGAGFIGDKLVILFESYQFYKMLKLAKKDVNALMEQYPDLITSKWVANYGGQSAQWPKLLRAMAIDKEAALKATSWGMFQPMGMYFAEIGYASVQEMVDDFNKGVDRQLAGFVKMVIHRGLHTALRLKQWAVFALGWNGAGYAKNRYDIKLEQAYHLYSN